MDVSVVLPTYNRANLICQSVNALLEQDVSGLAYEVIVVDNNSTDGTAAALDEIVRKDSRVRYILETRQGVSYARNAGIQAARAGLLAFCDDDVCATSSWVRAMHSAFQQYPEAAFIGGRILPDWSEPPPSWLKATMSPLGLQDYGDAPIVVSSGHQLCLVSGCLGVPRATFDKVGLFLTETQRVKGGLGSLEDLEWEKRAWDAGLFGVYLPEIVATGDVPLERLAKSYHRRWHLGHGKFYAKARCDNWDGIPHTILGVPRYTYRQAAEAAVKGAFSRLKGDQEEAFKHECALLFSLGFIQERWTN